MTDFLLKNKQKKYYIIAGVAACLLFMPGIVKYMDHYDAMEKELNSKGAATLAESSFGQNIASKEIETTNVVLDKPLVKPVAENNTITIAAPVIKNSQPVSRAEPLAAAGSLEMDIEPVDSVIDASDSLVSSEMTGPFVEPKSAVKVKTHSDDSLVKKATAKPVLKINNIQNTVIAHKAKTIISNQAKSYAVQVASFSNNKSASSLIARLKAKGFNPLLRLVTINSKNYYRVFVLAKNTVSLSAAKALNQALFEQYKISGYIRKITV